MSLSLSECGDVISDVSVSVVCGHHICYGSLIYMLPSYAVPVTCLPFYICLCMLWLCSFPASHLLYACAFLTARLAACCARILLHARALLLRKLPSYPLLYMVFSVLADRQTDRRRDEDGRKKKGTYLPLLTHTYML